MSDIGTGHESYTENVSRCHPMTGPAFDQGRLGELGVPYIIQNIGHVALSLRLRCKKMGNIIHKVVDVVSLPCMSTL